ncbi:imidazole glycerol phosphate synthase subunit HisH [Schleiferiaceae bacterium]|nr:imidazole glycerol phosphate synthase subunit HisH [Schleiferiaceae bacterium]
MKIVIIDYGMGNIMSLVSTLKYIGVEEVILSSDFDTINSADKIILPGVGSFGKAINRIRQSKIDIYLHDIVIVKKRPILGICLGMQLLGSSSTEDGNNKGLGFVKARVTEFNKSLVKVPHVGFNQVTVNYDSKLFQGIIDRSDFYFTHSYRMQSESNINQSVCNYQDDFIAAFELDNICGVQFHPELSQFNGLRLLSNFINNF